MQYALLVRVNGFRDSPTLGMVCNQALVVLQASPFGYVICMLAHTCWSTCKQGQVKAMDAKTIVQRAAKVASAQYGLDDAYDLSVDVRRNQENPLRV